MESQESAKNVMSMVTAKYGHGENSGAGNTSYSKENTDHDNMMDDTDATLQDIKPKGNIINDSDNNHDNMAASDHMQCVDDSIYIVISDSDSMKDTVASDDTTMSPTGSINDDILLSAVTEAPSSITVDGLETDIIITNIENDVQPCVENIQSSVETVPTTGITSDITTILSHVDGMETSITNIENDVSSVENIQSNAETVSTTGVTSDTTTISHVDSMETGITNFENDVSSVENIQSNAETVSTTGVTSDTTIISHVDGMETSITNIENDVSGVENIQSNAETVSTTGVTSDTTTISHVDGMETGITNIENDVSGVENIQSNAETVSTTGVTSDTTTISHVDDMETVTSVTNIENDASDEANFSVEYENHTQARTWYNLDLKLSPAQLTGCWEEFETGAENYLKGCKWAPDGSCLLTCSDHDNTFKLFNSPGALFDSEMSCDNLPKMKSVLNMREGETIYDYSWYPQMSSFDPVTSCFISTSRDHPVHMWDAFTGQVRCSYRPYNIMDEIESPHCVAFNLDGSRIFCGFNNTVRVFDTSRPGRRCEKRSTGKKKYGQRGIISCIAFSPGNNGVYACGSFSKSVGIYCEPKGTLACLLNEHKGGVTHLAFSPDGQRLYSGGRKDKEILCWDMRYLEVVLHRLVRSVTTNQRMYFDIDSSGRYLVSGNSNGVVNIWDTTAVSDDGEKILPHSTFTAHKDCVNGISLHPSLPVLATASGQRKFVLEDEEVGQDLEKTDCSVRLWKMGVHEDTSLAEGEVGMIS